ncbi:MAG: ABC transporter substrate-binding protein [Deltaproteobacteria bacterium]|nr:ABC transporter substrate-binding protein [Deltaproteobacteria bacterium]
MGKQEIRKGVTRREFIKTVGVAGAAAAGGSLWPGKSQAATRDHILIGFPTPATGVLADFGESTAWAHKRALKEINKNGGIFIKDLGKKLPVKVKLVDTESDPTKTAELTARLIMKEKVDLMVVLHTPMIVNPTSAICEKFQVPCIASDCPVDSWLHGGPYKWAYNFFWEVDQATDVHTGMWNLQEGKTNKIVGCLWPNDPDGVDAVKTHPLKFDKFGYKLVDVGRFPLGSPDFTSFISTWKKENVEILTGIIPVPDWIHCWRQCHQQGFIPKIVTMGKATLFPGAMMALGPDLAHGLTSDVWWSPHHPFKSSLTGESCRDLADAWTKDTGKYWTQPLGFDYAVFEVAAAALKRASSLDKAKIRDAIAKTDLETVAGPIKYNERHFSRTPMCGGQWQKGKERPLEMKIIYNKEEPNIPVTGKMVFPLSR